MNEHERRAQLLSELTEPDGDFPIGPVTIRGIEMPAYLTTPDSLRAVLATGDAWGDRLAITYEDEHYTWAEYSNIVTRVATALVNRCGIRKGDRVAIAMRNYPEWIFTFAAAASIGAVCVPLNAWWSGSELKYALADCDAKVLVADRERTELVHPKRAELPALHSVIEVRPGGNVLGDLEWSALLVDDIATIDPFSATIDTDDDVTIMYTSGTTGRPKGAVATHRAHITNLLNMRVHGLVEAQMARWRGEQQASPVNQPVTLIPGPLFHVSYLPKVIAAPTSGGHLVLMYKWDAQRAVELIEREKVDNLVAVPMVIRQLLDEIERCGGTPSSLRTLSTGGAQSTAALIRRIEGLPQVATGTGYGMTETCGPMMMIGSRDYFQRPLAVGRPLPTSQVRVVDPDGRDVTTGEVGEAWFRGPNVARGYWNRDSDGFTRDGWLRTGDLVKRDDDGFVYIIDRIKDIVIRAGENVYCSEVEETLGAHPAVEESAVFGVPHELWGEEVVAVVQARPDAAVTSDELRAHAERNLARFKVPTTIMVGTEPLPRNAAGKVLKRELRDRAHPNNPASEGVPR